jgi:hypothetical protein
MMRAACAAILAIAFGAAVPAWADGSVAQACADDYVNGQILRKEHKLLEARETLRRCAQSTCKAFIIKDCTTWLDATEASIPAVVPVAENEAGDAVLDVKVAMDGAELLSLLDGRSVEVDPGTHVFVFEAPDGRRAEKSVLVAEGNKAVRVEVTLSNPPPPEPPRAPPPTPVAKAPLPPAARRTALPWKGIGVGVGAVGVVGVAVGAGFGLDAISKLRASQCNSNDVCQNPAQKKKLLDAQQSGDISTVLVAAGGGLMVSGVLVWALAPASRVRVTASLAPRRASVSLGVAW